MKEHVEVVYNSFVDFEGKTHHFCVAAVSLRMPKAEELCSRDRSEEVYSCLTHYTDYDSYEEDKIVKGVKIGIAICNPDDKYDEALGREKAIARAKASKHWALLATKGGYINTEMVQAFIRQESKYIAENPALYIKGYADRENKYKEKLAKQAEYEAMTDAEKAVVDNPSSFDKILKFLLCRK